MKKRKKTRVRKRSEKFALEMGKVPRIVNVGSGKWLKVAEENKEK